jgi:hypothetical protein
LNSDHFANTFNLPVLNLNPSRDEASVHRDPKSARRAKSEDKAKDKDKEGDHPREKNKADDDEVGSGAMEYESDYENEIKKWSEFIYTRAEGEDKVDIDDKWDEKRDEWLQAQGLDERGKRRATPVNAKGKKGNKFSVEVPKKGGGRDSALRARKESSPLSDEEKEDDDEEADENEEEDEDVDEEEDEEEEEEVKEEESKSRRTSRGKVSAKAAPVGKRKRDSIDKKTVEAESVEESPSPVVSPAP